MKSQHKIENMKFDPFKMTIIKKFVLPALNLKLFIITKKYLPKN